MDWPCSPHNPTTYGFEDLIIKTRVYGEVDRRGELSKLATSLKLTKAQSDQIRAAVGVLYCKAAGGFPPLSETAFLIGSNKEITTAGHGLVDKFGTQRDLRSCYFENFQIPPKRVELLPDSPRNIISSQTWANNNMRDDRARIELKTPLSGVIPLAPDFSEKKLAKGTPIILAAAQHDDFKSSGVDPILSPCSVQDYFDLRDGLSRMKTDCDAGKGASGGVYLIQIDGKIYAKGIELAGAPYSEVPNHAPFNNETNAEVALVIDQSFLSWYSK